MKDLKSAYNKYLEELCRFLSAGVERDKTELENKESCLLDMIEEEK